MIYYTIGAILTYFLAANILDRLEVNRGKRFEYRNLIFFVLIFALALVYMFLVNPEPELQGSGTQSEAPEQYVPDKEMPRR
ncbi:MAG: hypothetical protein ACE5F3_03400 [Mariprofundaceae bacterium]